MIGERLFMANKIAEKVWWKYHGEDYQRWEYGDPWFCNHIIDTFTFPPVGIYRKTRVFCSNPICCGNPRRKKKGKDRLTLQERRVI
jgi:hypothetical protein